MQSIEESFSSKQKIKELIDNEAVSTLTKKAPEFDLLKKIGGVDKSEVDTADSSKQKSVTFNIPQQTPQISINVSTLAPKPDEAKPEAAKSLFGWQAETPDKSNAVKTGGVKVDGDKGDAQKVFAVTGSLFAAPKPAAEADKPKSISLFDKPVGETSTGLFGKPSDGASLFSKPAETRGADDLFSQLQEAKPKGADSKPEGTLFCKPADTKPTEGSLFGKPADTKLSEGGLFGKPADTKPTEGSLFGKPADTKPTEGSLFGKPLEIKSSSSGLFGPIGDGKGSLFSAAPTPGGLFQKNAEPKLAEQTLPETGNKPNEKEK